MFNLSMFGFSMLRLDVFDFGRQTAEYVDPECAERSHDWPPVHNDSGSGSNGGVYTPSSSGTAPTDRDHNVDATTSSPRNVDESAVEPAGISMLNTATTSTAPLNTSSTTNIATTSTLLYFAPSSTTIASDTAASAVPSPRKTTKRTLSHESTDERESKKPRRRIEADTSTLAPATKRKAEDDTVEAGDAQAKRQRLETLGNSAPASAVESNKTAKAKQHEPPLSTTSEPERVGAPEPSVSDYAAPPPPAFRLPDLPAEIRGKILAELVIPDHGQVATPSLTRHWPCPECAQCMQPTPVTVPHPAIFRANKQLCPEATALFYGHWKWTVVAGPRLC